MHEASRGWCGDQGASSLGSSACSKRGARDTRRYRYMGQEAAAAAEVRRTHDAQPSPTTPDQPVRTGATRAPHPCHQHPRPPASSSIRHLVPLVPCPSASRGCIAKHPLILLPHPSLPAHNQPPSGSQTPELADVQRVNTKDMQCGVAPLPGSPMVFIIKYTAVPLEPCRVSEKRAPCL